MRTTFTAVVMLVALTACGGGESRTTTTSSSVSSVAGLPRNELEELEKSLHTTDLTVTATTAGGDPLTVNITNRGPNPADDVWLEVTVARQPDNSVPDGCTASQAGFECRIGVVAARQTVARQLQAASAGPLEVRVADRSGTDVAPDDNKIVVR